ncbi:MAG: polyprenyl synthetase family protein [Alphaproteobacteria bacterium]
MSHLLIWSIFFFTTLMDLTLVHNFTATATFKQRLSDCASLIEKRLERWLVDSAENGFVPKPLTEAMQYAALGGGKRLRPFLVLESARLCGIEPQAALDTAVALECVHCYSLVHDDLPAMDDDDMRRGRPTVHRAFNEATAILAGDSLLTLAFEILAAPATHTDASVRGELALGLARAAGRTGMAGGQMLDLEAEASGGALSEDAILRLQGMKTGALITFACEAGAMLAQTGPSQRAALRRYGDALGLAFQLADDLLDIDGDAAIVGKAVAKDAEAGKATLVSLMGIETARQRLNALEDEARVALASFGEAADTLLATAQFVITRRY